MIAVNTFGTAPDGACVHVYTLSVDDLCVRVTDFGATVLGIICSDTQGIPADIALGFDTLDGYLDNPACYGATIGPVANRTADAEIAIAGETWHLTRNEGENNLHTDLAHGLHKRVWKTHTEAGRDRVAFSCTLAHGELGLPGERTFQVSYELMRGGWLVVSHRCDTDRPTFVNMTNHSYFNLAGHAAGSVRDQMAAVPATRYLPLRADSIPAGDRAPVAGTPFDLTRPRALGEVLDTTNAQLEQARGVDHCLCVDGYAPGSAPRWALTAWDPASGRRLSIAMTQPAGQLYTGNWLGDTNAKEGVSYGPHAGFAFEPEFYPDCAHHATWPQPVCTPDEPYSETIAYRFDTATTADAAFALDFSPEDASRIARAAQR